MKKTKVIWIVEGQTGEWDDYRTWPIVAYTNRELAEQHVQRARARAAQIRDENGTITVSGEVVSKGMGDLDPTGQSMDYTGTTYYTYPVRVGAALPKGKRAE